MGQLRLTAHELSGNKRMTEYMNILPIAPAVLTDEIFLQITTTTTKNTNKKTVWPVPPPTYLTY